MGRTSTNFQGRYTAMLSESIRGYAQQLLEIRARETTTKKLLRGIGEEQEEELTGACTMAVGRRQACRQDLISLSDVPERKKTSGTEEEEAGKQ
jgi:hypothetical protein